jgi:EAL domain-containing protein (putative c-di-GMP-specific phosphodiesterase class I)
MSIPIHLDNGDLYGMFCCLSARPNPSLNERDLNTMKMFAELAAEQVSDRVRDQREFATKSNAIRDTIDNDRFHLVFQPIVDLLSGEPIGYESLSRFVVEPYRPPNVWFDDAATVGIGTELECLAIEKALAEVCRLPDEMYASLNVSPETLLTERFHDIFADGGDLGRLMLEITEHSRVDNYQEVHQVLAPLRERGMKIAVDDAGAGYASLSHILQLQADVIKLDMGLVRDIDKDDARRALAAGMVMFASEMGIKVIAEGVETEAEKETLQSLGIFAGQGYLLGKPAKSRSTSSLSTH